ncbi:MAG: glycine betaine ABC transporter substrate-binding protein, partial [Bacillota bacterium]
MAESVKKLGLVFTAFLLIITIVACGEDFGEDDSVIKLAQGDWESHEVHNQIAKIIMEEGYDKDTDTVTADTPVVTQSLKTGDLDVNVEMWSDNVETYDEDLEAGEYHEISVNFDDNAQGFYIPKYLQEENPGLKTVQDLPEYKELFPHPEVTEWDPEEDKAIIYGGPSGFAATDFLENKFENDDEYSELIEHFDFWPLESTATLNTTLTDAYEDEEPWVGYNWEPTWIMGKYEMVLLEDEKDYSSDTHKDGVGNLPPTRVTVVVTDGFEDQHPDVHEFLSNYETSSDLTSEALAYMQDNDV